MTKIPESVEKSIFEEYKKEPTGKRSNMLNYFIQNKLKILIEHIDEF